MSKPTKFFSFPFYNAQLKVTVTRKASQVDKWVSFMYSLRRRSSSDRFLVGLDTEWRPNLKPGDNHPVATLQLLVGVDCLIFQLLHADSIPQSLRVFLADPSNTFCGVGIKEDCDRLLDHHGLQVGSMADLNALALMAGGEDRKFRHMGLKKMCMAVLGKEMEKPLDVTLSAWDDFDLDGRQVIYAATDACVSFQLAFVLLLRIMNPKISVYV